METHLIQHCSPTLAGIKTANLFAYPFSCEELLAQDLATVNTMLNPKGIYAEVLRIRYNSALVFVYRTCRLQEDLNRPGVQRFMDGYGYKGNATATYINRLKLRLAFNDDFPHEIGLFLGYPLVDVIGFIENKGRGSKCVGHWKVYDNERHTQRLFAMYNKCKAVYTHLYAQGKPLERLIVTA